MGVDLGAAFATKGHGSPGAAVSDLKVGLGLAADETELVRRTRDVGAKGRSAHLLAIRAVTDGDVGRIDFA